MTNYIYLIFPHIYNRPTRLHCRYCNDTYALPNNGSIKLYNELTCPYDNFEIVSYSNGTKGKG